jgi:hypothetical protein
MGTVYVTVATLVDFLELLLAQKFVDDRHSRDAPSHGLEAGRLEHEMGRVTEFATQIGIDQALDILAWIHDISDRVENIRLGILRRRLQREARRRTPVMKELPFTIRKLTGQNGPSELGRDPDLFQGDQKSVGIVDRLGLTDGHVDHLTNA